MPADPLQVTRKDFLWTVAGTVLLSQQLVARPPPGKVLLIVAHPDDEYAFAGAVYHPVREKGGTADQVIVTKNTFSRKTLRQFPSRTHRSRAEGILE
jgi:LmbE family N-acetylglucosaminyl deacetylase